MFRVIVLMCVDLGLLIAECKRRNQHLLHIVSPEIYQLNNECLSSEISSSVEFFKLKNYRKTHFKRR